MTFSDQSVMMMHFQHGFNLRHGIKINSDKNQQGSSSKEVSELTWEVEQALYETRDQGDKRQVQRAGKNDSVENSRQVFFHLLTSDARDRPAVFPDILGDFLRVQRDLCIEVGKKDDEQNIEEVIPETGRSEPV